LEKETVDAEELQELLGDVRRAASIAAMWE